MGTPSRREFIGQLVAGVGGPLVVSRTVLAGSAHAAQPSDQVAIGLIGCGMRGRQLSGYLPSTGRIVATCDANLPRAEALASLQPHPVRAYQDYRRMMDAVPLDAVIVCATDVHHVHAALLACNAGMDVYVEKPLSVYVNEGRSLANAAANLGRIVQTGTQQRSLEANRFACEFIRSGGIGEVREIEAVSFDSPRRYPQDGLPEEQIPQGLYWDLWQGPAQRHPYNQQLARHWSQGYPWWGGWYDYGGGGMTGLGSHAFDMIQYALGMDHTGPVAFDYEPASGNTTDSLSFRYANGTNVRLKFADKRPYRGPRNGAVFLGTECKMEVNRAKYVTNPPDFVTDGPPSEPPPDFDRNSATEHLQDWIDCIKTRRKPRADAETGHRVATICHLCNIARQLRRSLQWDPANELVIGDAEANVLLDRERQPSWEIESLA